MKLKFLTIDQIQRLQEQMKELLNSNSSGVYKKTLDGFPSKMWVGKNEFVIVVRYSEQQTGSPDYCFVEITKISYNNNLDCNAFFADVFGEEGKIIQNEAKEIIAKVEKLTPEKLVLESKPCDSRGWAIMSVLLAFTNCINQLVSEDIIRFFLAY